MSYIIKSMEKIPSQKLESLTPLVTLGSGAFSKVRLVKTKDEELLALKVYSKHTLLKKKHSSRLLHEKSLLQSLSHAGIPLLFDTFQDEFNVYFLMEYVNGGELFARIKSLETIPVFEAQFYTLDLSFTLEYLHLQDIAYRDLKPENVLIDNKGYLKLVDFGFASYTNEKRLTMCGTPDYLAPEIIMGKGHDKEVDLWALGVLIYEMLVGKSPFADKSPINVYQKILMGRYKIPEHLDPLAADLIRALLNPSPEKRIDLKELRKHQWFEHLQVAAVEHRDRPAPWIPNQCFYQHASFCDENHDKEYGVFEGF